MVGALTPEVEKKYGRLLSPYLEDSSHLFVISSDFCHWGRRFNYTNYDRSHGPIYKSIEVLDKDGMATIESGEPQKFTEYLRKTGMCIIREVR